MRTAVFETAPIVRSGTSPRWGRPVWMAGNATDAAGLEPVDTIAPMGVEIKHKGDPVWDVAVDAGGATV